MAEDPTPRQLLKQIPGSSFVFDQTIPTPLGSSATNGWEVLPGVPADVAVFRTYIDLAGYTRDDLTTFVQGVDIQKSIIPIETGSMVGCYEFDFITTRRIRDDELLSLFSLPGFLTSTVDLMEMVYGERMIYGQNTTVPGTFVQVSGESFGSGNPSAADRLHWTRLYVTHQAVENDILVIPETNLVVQAVTAHEKDLVYIERLRRAYTQQRSET